MASRMHLRSQLGLAWLRECTSGHNWGWRGFANAPQVTIGAGVASRMARAGNAHAQSYQREAEEHVRWAAPRSDTPEKKQHEITRHRTSKQNGNGVYLPILCEFESSKFKRVVMELSAKLEMQTSSHGAFELKGFTTTTPEPTAKLCLLKSGIKITH